MIETKYDAELQLQTLNVIGTLTPSDLLSVVLKTAEVQPALVLWDCREGHFPQADEFYQTSFKSFRETVRNQRKIHIKPRCAYVARNAYHEERIRKIIESMSPSWQWATFTEMAAAEEWLFKPKTSAYTAAKRA